MEKRLTFTVDGANTDCYVCSASDALRQLLDPAHTFLLTDEHVFAAHPLLFTGWRTIVVPAGEAHKQPATVQYILEQLIQHEADRSSVLVGIGGGVITDMAGYAAGIYMRGIRCGFVPTSVLAMVDAALGGKNGVDMGLYKNLVGLIRQPEFLVFDTTLLETLPEQEWRNGFAEIIKHAVLFDVDLFVQLEDLGLTGYRSDHTLLEALILKNVTLKYTTVMQDPLEKGLRKKLNFGHTLGHAIETIHQLPHGYAISLGMVAAARLGEELTNFPSTDKERLVQLLQQIGLPVQLNIDWEAVLQLIRLDKKRRGDEIHFILPKAIGEAVIQPIPLMQLSDLIRQNF